MTQQQFENRKERAENEPLVIARTDEGFRVYSPSNRIRSYIVSGSVHPATSYGGRSFTGV